MEKEGLQHHGEGCVQGHEDGPHNPGPELQNHLESLPSLEIAQPVEPPPQLESTPETAQEQEAATVVNPMFPGLQNWLKKDLREQANEILEEFDSSRKGFLKVRDTIFSHEPITDRIGRRLPWLAVTTAEIVRNFILTKEEFLFAFKRRRSEQELQDVTIQARVLNREGFLEDGDVQRLLNIKDNKPVLRELCNQEIFLEIPVDRVLLVRGLTTIQLNVLAHQLGHAPVPSFAANRKENGGRFALDNTLINGKHPFEQELRERGATEEEIREDLVYWRPVFPNAPKWAFWRKWKMSRTHCPVYACKDVDGSDALFLPVHIDPKNLVAVIGDFYRRLLRRPKVGRTNALEYHRQPGADERHGGQRKKVGTGIYDLGIAHFLKLLRRAKEQGIIREVEVEGEEHLRTTLTVSGDDRILAECERIYNHA